MLKSISQMQPVKIKQGVAGPIYKLNLPMLLQKSSTRLPAHEEAFLYVLTNK